MAGREGQSLAGVTPERRARRRAPASRRYSRPAIFLIIGLLAVIAGLGVPRFVDLAPDALELVAWFLTPLGAAIATRPSSDPVT